MIGPFPRDPNRIGRKRALIDSGSNLTVIGSKLAAELGLSVGRPLEMLGFQGIAAVHSARAEIGLLASDNRAFFWRTELAVAPESADMILGLRDLARGILVIDGPAGTWEWALPPAAFD